ncbi:MAG TPA: ANTAR domain-containing protein [Candidatus Limnocylindrales bacterium]|nr:ANTAR domain-containing protein [Candidatus Limnocylindrales bacterium]
MSREPDKGTLQRPGMLAAVAGLFGTDAAALTLLDADHTELWVAASNPTARLAQDLEYTLGEGPARDSTAGDGAILERGPGLHTRWRRYGPAVRQIGIEAVAAVPLPWSAGYFGALTVFDPACTFFDPANAPAMGSLRAVARDLTIAVLNANAQPALLAQGDHRAQVHQAAGIVSVQCGCGVAEALLLLKAYSYAHGEGIGSVAARVLRHELRLDVP